jgi:signal transduction histidine kinase
MDLELRTPPALDLRDHGGGVDPSDTSRIFGKYYQADAGASGVGLGLFISRGLARAHGGDLTVRPAANDGSEFVIDLPRHA